MLDELLQDRAALYVAGALTAPEREQFELILEFHDEARELVRGLAEAAGAVAIAEASAGVRPSEGVRARVLAAIGERARGDAGADRQARGAEGFVLTGADALVQWVNPAFTAMCGYTAEELRGKKLGPILQGPQTDAATVERMRRAVHEYRPCRETILNYEKNGRPYWVEIEITPICDEAGQPLWLAAREREVAGAPA